MLAPGCTFSYDLGPVGGGEADIPDQIALPTPDVPTEEAPPLEECNGVDDDLDGEVDEGFTDFDGDGAADCDGPTCPALDLGVAGAVPVVAECTGTEDGKLQDPWSATPAWSWVSPVSDPLMDNGVSALVAGQLDDDNQDGLIDDNDVADIVTQSASSVPGCACGEPGFTVAIDGRTGAEKWRYASGTGVGAVVADIDADGTPDVLTVTRDGSLLLLGATGLPIWTSHATANPRRMRPPVVADLNGDGRPEIIAGALVLDGPSGELRTVLDEPYPNAAGVAAVADIDLDGVQEILYQGGVFAPSGALLWKADLAGGHGMWPVVIQADDDAAAEVAWVGREFSVWDDDGTPLATPSSYQGDTPGAPCAGDLDDDGRAELAWADGDKLLAFDLDGSLLWQVATSANEEAGCSTFDLDGDHTAEILVSTVRGVAAYDGSEGTLRFEIDAHVTPAPGTYPIALDADRDGHAEILLGGRATDGVPVLASFVHDGGGWAPAGASWPSYDYAVGNILPDGTVPQRPGAWWSEFGAYRGRPAGDIVSRPDLTVTITDVCIADCSLGPVKVGVQVQNQGGRDQYAGGRLVLYALDGGSRREVASTTLASIPAGYANAGIEFELTPADLGRDGFVAVVEDDGSDADFLPDCNTGNQQAGWTEVECP